MLTKYWRPSNERRPLSPTTRVWNHDGYSGSGIFAGKSRCEGTNKLAGGRCPRASWGRSWLYSRWKSLKRDCCVRSVRAGGCVVSCLRVR